MGLNKRILIGGAAQEAFDPLKNFETVTYTGNGGTQKITGYIRKGAAFNGSSSRIDIPAIIPSNLKSVSFWINSTDTGANKQIFAMGRVSNYVWLNIRLNAGKIEAGYGSDNGAYLSGSAITTNSTFNDGNWHHVVCTFTGTYGTSQAPNIYVDGSDVATTALSSSGSAISSPSGAGAIGYYGAQNIIYISGKIDQVRIFNKALSTNNNGVNEIDELYRETYDSSTKSTTDIFNDGSGVALYELDEDANSSNFGQAAVFNGSSSYVGMAENSWNSFTSYTLSAWIYDTGAATGNRTIASNYGYTAASNVEKGWIVMRLGGKLRISNSTTGLASTYLSTNDIPFNQWTHIVVTNTQSEIKIYFNGSLDSTHSTIGFLNDASWPMRPAIGVYRYETTEVRNGYFSGTIDQVRIYDTALSSGDVTNLYNESSVPTSGLVAHYKLDGNATDETGSYDGTASNITYSTGVYGGTPTNVNFLGMAFQPDLVWIKGRTPNNVDHVLNDSVRGVNKTISTSNTDDEESPSDYGGVGSFDSNGFTTIAGSDTIYAGGIEVNGNLNGQTYVAWCWKAGGAAVSNTDGVTSGSVTAVTSTVSANADAGFSINKFTTPSSGFPSWGHGLSSAPELIILKATGLVQNWIVYAPSILGQKDAYLNSNAAFSSTYSPDVISVDSSKIDLGRAGYGLSGSSEYIAYCFHSVDGYQSVGSYTGTGATGNTVTTGFRPRFVMLKITSESSGWVIIDSERNDKYLLANTANADASLDIIDFNSDGFTFKGGSMNGSGHSHIYLAIA